MLSPLIKWSYSIFIFLNILRQLFHNHADATV